MDEVEEDNLISTWISYHRDHQESEFWAYSAYCDITLSEPEKAWGLILKTLSACGDDDNLIGNLAAGPLEDFLVEHGKAYLEKVLKEASKNPRFNYLLGGVWQNAMNEEVWQAVCAARKEVW